MNKKILFSFFLLLTIGVVLAVEPAWAGPGGKIAKAVFETFWGKVALVLLVLFFLPLIIITLVRESLAIRRATRDLRYMAQHHPNFEWLKVRERILDCFYRIHAAWRREDMVEASEYMSSRYWQNQQMVFLDRWEQEGLINNCDVKKIISIKPLLFVHRNDGVEHEGSLLVALIDANMKDYLAERGTGKVVEGSKRYKDVETVWSFTMIEDKWRVSNIEEGSFSLDYAELARTLPQIEDTVPGNSRV